jgi:hypothetical protein
MDVTAVSGLLSSARAAADVAKALVGLNTSNEVNKVAVGLQIQILSLIDQIHEAKASQSALMDQIGQLEKEKAEIENFTAELEKYQFYSPWQGTLVYARKQSVENPQPPHYLCANCVAQHKKSILQSHKPDKGSWYHVACPRCSATYATTEMGPPLFEYPSQAA